MSLIEKMPNQALSADAKRRAAEAHRSASKLIKNMKTKIKISKIQFVRKELERRKRLLIEFTRSSSVVMDPLDVECIISFFQRNEHPERPKDVPHIMRKFFTSCFSYAPLRRYLASVAGSIPDSFMLPACLAKVFFEKKFAKSEKWYPPFLYAVANDIQIKSNYDLKSKKFKPRMISVILSGSNIMAEKLKNGIDSFFVELEAVNKEAGSEIWKYVLGFSKNIYNVGPNLICDFIKGIGFDRFVKVDHHLKREFPELIGLDECHRLNDKEHFILSQHLADHLGISPFHLDHLLYQWGRYKKYA